MFVVCDGPNGAGKTSLINDLKADGVSTLSSPQETPLSLMLRPACRGTDPWEDIDPKVQFMLFSAARYDEYVRLVHGQKKVCVADRWWTSTYVYQCIFQGIPVDFMEYTIHPEEQIDLVILLDGEDDELIQRVIGERSANPEHGVCTWTQKEESMKRIMAIYRNELKAYLESRDIPVEVIDSTGLSTDTVKGIVSDLIAKYGGEI